MQTSFTLKIKDYDETGRIVTIGTKEMYSVDESNRASVWVRNSDKLTVEFPNTTSGVSIKNNANNRTVPDMIGHCYLHSNNVQYNQTNAAMFSMPFGNPGDFPVTSSNFDRAVVLFAARKLIESNWLTCKDEYMVPNTNHPDYQQFVNDAVVFSLFHSASNQSSLRNITYKDKNWNILNHFFFMSNEEMRNLANQHNFLELYNDTLNHPNDRFVFNHLNGLELSPDASAVLEMAKNLIRVSFPLRQAAHQVNPEYHLHAHDAGFYQIRNGLLKNNFKSEYEAFMVEYKKFGNRLKELVYELGFLKR